jgi:2-hydroxychromene-2-carboxylate isomerase
MDVFRSAAFYGVPLKIPRPWPMRSRLALQVSVVAAQEQWYGAFRRRVFRAAWAEQLDIGDEAVVVACMRDAAGEAASVLAVAATAEIRERLHAMTQEAMADGIFGVPLMVFAGERFFGRDRLDMLEWRLRGRPASAAGF